MSEKHLRKSIDTSIPRFFNIDNDDGTTSRFFLNKKLIREIQEEEIKNGGFLPFLTILPWLIKGAVGLGTVAAAGSTVYKNIKEANKVNTPQVNTPQVNTPQVNTPQVNTPTEQSNTDKWNGDGLNNDLPNDDLPNDDLPNDASYSGDGIYLPNTGEGLYLDPYFGGSLKRYINLTLKRSGKPIPLEFKNFLKSFDNSRW